MSGQAGPHTWENPLVRDTTEVLLLLLAAPLGTAEGTALLLLLLLCLGLSGSLGPFHIKSNKLSRSLGYRSNPQDVLLQKEWLGAEGEGGGGGDFVRLHLESGHIHH